MILDFLDYGLMDNVEKDKHIFDNVEKRQIKEKGMESNVKHIESNIVQKTCKENAKTLNNYVAVEPVTANKNSNSKRKSLCVFDKIKKSKYSTLPEFW